jgi:hypothetical protein
MVEGKGLGFRVYLNGCLCTTAARAELEEESF